MRVNVELEGYQAWRENDADMVPNEEKEDPGFLLTLDLDTGGNPLKEKLICRALVDAPAPALKRFVRVKIENGGSGTPPRLHDPYYCWTGFVNGIRTTRTLSKEAQNSPHGCN